MPSTEMSTSLTYLKGVGPHRASLLASELGLRTFNDLIQHFPFRYIDKTIIYKPNEVTPGPAEIQVRGFISEIKSLGNGPKKRLSVMLTSDNSSIELIWFKGINWVRKSIKIGSEIIAFGRISQFNDRFSISHPELELATSLKMNNFSGLHPVYPSTEKLTASGLNSKGLSKLILELIKNPHRSRLDWIPESIVKSKNWPNRKIALKEMHYPKNSKRLSIARDRLAFEEIFLDQLVFAFKRKSHLTQHSGHLFSKLEPNFNSFYKKILPFNLTNAQKNVIKEIRKNAVTGLHMNRLIQGDVGSGKTLVAFMSILMAIDNGYQAAFMAPTEILAQQHHSSLEPWVKALGLKIGILTGSIKAAARKPLFKDIASGELDILVGTHALIEDPVIFNNLGIAIIDEQHRFGVAQRAKLRKKNNPPPHILVMTATPIPRTLAMSLYGDLDLSIIDELPPGRKPIKTVHRTDHNRLQVWGFIKNQISKGRQVYIVYPLIEESEKLDFKDLMDGYESVTRDFPRPEYQISIVHGRMKAEDKQWEMQRFAKGETQIMVSTTVIEVGVDVANASVMIIENAEKFGLSQLHQLRGRVGRGKEQSYCILLTKDKLSDNGRVRIDTLCETNDGFEIANVDMQLRGPGEVMGTRQSGSLDYKIANILQDGELIEWSRKLAEEIVLDDPHLEKPDYEKLRLRFSEYSRHKIAWGTVA
ncbi:MAG: ATP-dependent DNA helicase RecG [Owenweeksia sp. TMED14]|nr:MAG: ATP-dependent DNA helicase RecG [Owenweeksia sp. TMED14]|tara:strand:+ start:460 stop:2565 length:2106 start_codon:yes stop_codon:yes gene_type:complete